MILSLLQYQNISENYMDTIAYFQAKINKTPAVNC